MTVAELTIVAKWSTLLYSEDAGVREKCDICQSVDREYN